MTLTFPLLSEELQNARLVAMLADGALKGFVLLALAGICCLCWRKASAATRHLVWFGAILGTLCFPPGAQLVPAWREPLWTVGTRLEAGNQLTLVMGMVPGREHRSPVQGASGSAKESPSSVPRPAQTDSRPIVAELGSWWLSVVLIVWSCGFLVVIARLLVDRLRLRTLLRGARRPSSAEWSSLLDELGRQLELRRHVVLLQSFGSVMPVTWGSIRPVILLPAQADQWPGERRRVVLLHELAHVKRWDCLSQLISRIVCALYWFNPLVWLASSRMCIERERACDDLVLESGLKPSDYAGHLVEIARTFAPLPRMAGIAMARSSQLRKRISSIVRTCASRRVDKVAVLAVWAALAVAALAFGGNPTPLPAPASADAQSLLENQLAQLRLFSAAKLKQSQVLAAAAGESINPEFQRFFDAATTGDFQTVTNMYVDFHRRHPQYSRSTGQPDLSLRTSYWSPVLEICLAYDHVIQCEPKYTSLLANEMINSIPKGSIYFGGTDPGRGIPTAFSKSQIDGDPFYTLTQNALADGTYLQYLRSMYGGSIYTLTDEDSQRCFHDYLNDATRRLEHDRLFPAEPKQIRPGENVRMENGHPEVSGQVAVMSINGLLTKVIFDRNPEREFYIEESFPLDWMYPYLEPHGVIMKINREPLTELPEATVARDHDYWQNLVARMLGNWFNQDTSVNEIADFVNRVYVQKNLVGFSGDPSFIQNSYSKQTFSKLRSSIAGVYAWRVDHPANPHEVKRLSAETDVAFRQAIALCPYSSEAVSRYATFLQQQNRAADALVIAASAAKVDPKNGDIQNLLQQLKDSSGTK